MPVEPTVGPRGWTWLDGEGDAMRGDLPPGLVVVGAHGRESLAHDEGGLAFVDPGQDAAHDEGGAAGEEDAGHQEPPPGTQDGDLLAKFQGRFPSGEFALDGWL